MQKINESLARLCYFKNPQSDVWEPITILVWQKLSSGKKTASALIYSGVCFYFGFVCVTGAANRIITIYDGISAAGTEIEYFVADANKPTDGHSHADPIICQKGIYAAIPGGGETVVIYYYPM